MITNIPINDGTWHRIAATRLEHTLSIYVGGQLDRRKTSANIANVNNNSVLRIASSGCVEIGAINPFGGLIDELRIWNRALDSEEILQNKNCELEGDESGLIAYYDFNQGIALEENTEEVLLFDRSSNEHNGTLLNFSLLGTTNETGWSALPVGLRAPVSENYFEEFGTTAYFWTSDISTNGAGTFYSLSGNQSDLKFGDIDKNYGLSIRCLKDR